jgi:stress response protein YsnF
VPDAGGPLSEDVYEVVRYEERVVITKQLVPVERVRLIRRIVTTDQTVAGQVRSELIDIEQTDIPRASPAGET